MQIFLGKPSGKIFDWMNTHQYDPVTPDPPTPPPPEEPDPWADNYWANLVLALESGSDITDLESYYVVEDYGKMIKNKSTYTYNKETDSSTFLDWRILGRNLEIPAYVKYRRQIGEPGDANYGFKRIYLKTTGNDNNLITFAQNSQYTVYLRNVDTEEYTATNKTAIAGEITMTYGNENTYNVPATVVYDGKEYVFAGYNLTLDTNADLRFNALSVIQFDEDNRNSWAISTVRQQLQQNVADRFKAGEDDSSEFTKYVIPCVTRTWLYNDADYIATALTTTDTGVSSIVVSDIDVNQNETTTEENYTTTIDKYWLLAVPSYGFETDTHKDKFFITSNYNKDGMSEVSSEAKRKKYAILEDGTLNPINRASGHMLRSANTASNANKTNVMFVGSDGNLYINSLTLANARNGVSPVCIIG